MNDTSPNQDLKDLSQEDEQVNGYDYKRISTSKADPFMLLKEVVQMSKYMTSGDINGSNKTSEFQMKCEENLTNYKAMVQSNYDKMLGGEGDSAQKALAERYNPSALQEKIKKFKFTKVNADQPTSKDTNWF